MSKEEQIILVINAILDKFQSVYCTPRFYGEFTKAKNKFLEGYCGILAIILKNIFPEGEYYHFGNAKMGHILLKIEDYFYDATGIVTKEFLEIGTLTKLDNIYEATSTLPWDFLYDNTKVKYYDEMIEVCTEAGKEALKNITNSLSK